MSPSRRLALCQVVLVLGCQRPVPLDEDASDRGDGGVLADAARTDALDAASTADASLPAPEDWITAGGDSTCASRGGRVSCWGTLWDGRVVPAPVELPELRGAEGVALTRSNACARWRDGRIACAGADDGGQLARAPLGLSRDFLPIPAIDDVLDLAVGLRFACAVRSDRTVWCWGDDSVGETGQPIPAHPTGGLAPQPVPARVEGLANVVAVEAGEYHACALDEGGGVACWGHDGWGALGRGVAYTGLAQPRPAPIEHVDDAVALALSGIGGCVVRRDGSAACWGGAVYAYPGYDSATDDDCLYVVAQACWRAPRSLEIEPATDLLLGGLLGCARGVEAWSCFGHDGEGVLPPPALPIPAEDHVTLGARHLCTLAPEGAIACRGRGDAGQLGDGRSTTADEWVPVALP